MPALPFSPNARVVTDGGLETDLLFNHGVDLPEFAAFPLLEDTRGLELLSAYYTAYAEVAAHAGATLLLETPTWRANPEWGAKLGYDGAALRSANHRAVDLLRGLTPDIDLEQVLVSGVVGPRGDGYVPTAAAVDEAASYHSAQIAAFAEAGVDVVHAMTVGTTQEAEGIVQAARASGLPVLISFTVETDGAIPDGTPLGEAIRRVDAGSAPDAYGINCAHPTHIANALDGGDWQARIAALRPNASTMSHAELDEMEVLDSGDLGLLTSSMRTLRDQLTQIQVLGGCCGTDVSHVAALWGVPTSGG
jgi:S-methylmethionine-dependent homocysteine/selenocysteine methylase